MAISHWSCKYSIFTIVVCKVNYKNLRSFEQINGKFNDFIFPSTFPKVRSLFESENTEIFSVEIGSIIEKGKLTYQRIIDCFEMNS